MAFDYEICSYKSDTMIKAKCRQVNHPSYLNSCKRQSSP